MVAAPIQHISLDKRGIAYIAGTTMKVASIVIDSQTWGMTPQEIQTAYPRLSLSQIYAALAYYHDFKSEIDAQLIEMDREFDSLKQLEVNPLSRSILAARLSPQNIEELPK